MPDPRPEESRSEFLTRCIPFVLNEDPDLSKSQAAAMCHSYFDKARTADALTTNIEQTKKTIAELIANEKQEFGVIIEKAIQEIFDESIKEVQKELQSAATTPFEFNSTNAVQKILKDNAKTINFELFDAIEKEIGLMLTDINLNGVPISNTKLKAEVQRIFKTKESRLMSQVITETTRTANRAFEYGYKESGIVVSKQWVAVIDDKTTSICLNGNGEIRDIGEPFSTGDYTAPFHINCRSRIAPITLQEVQQQ